jgi:hypothetical protein
MGSTFYNEKTKEIKMIKWIKKVWQKHFQFDKWVADKLAQRVCEYLNDGKPTPVWDGNKHYTTRWGGLYKSSSSGSTWFDRARQSLGNQSTVLTTRMWQSTQQLVEQFKSVFELEITLRPGFGGKATGPMASKFSIYEDAASATPTLGNISLVIRPIEWEPSWKWRNLIGAVRQWHVNYPGDVGTAAKEASFFFINHLSHALRAHGLVEMAAQCRIHDDVHSNMYTGYISAAVVVADLEMGKYYLLIYTVRELHHTYLLETDESIPRCVVGK